MTSSDFDKEVKLPLHEDLRKQDVPFDFAINVGKESFAVHRITLTTHSEYFRAMLAHDTKENQQGFVDMKEVSLAGVKECAEFMYSGKVNVEPVTVEDILQVADMMQLAKVIKTCTDVLNQTLEPGNCIFVYNLATKYNFSELQEKTLKIFKGVCVLEVTELLQLSKASFVKFLETHSLGHEFAWGCIINWIKYDLEKRSEFIHDLVKLIDWNIFPSAKFLRRIWAESFFRKSKKCREFIFKNLFLDLGKLELNLCLENYFILKTLSNEFEYVIKQIKDLFHNFLKLNFLVLSRQPGFKLLNENEFISLFTDEASRGIVSEKWKWNAMITWIKDDHTRKKYLPFLMKTIKFNLLPKLFLEIDVRYELLIRESKECSLVLVDVLLNQMTPRQTSASVAVLYSDGRIIFFDVESKCWKKLLNCPNPVQKAVIFNFNGKLCLINGSKLFYLHGRQWVERRSMTYCMTGLKKITTLGDCIYVVFKNRMLCYNSLHDRWVDFAIPAYGGIITSVAALNGIVYLCTQCVFRGGKDFRFDVKNNVWLSRSSYLKTFSLAVVDDAIYACENSQDLRIWDLNDANKRWELVVGIPDSSIEFNSTLSTLLDLNGRFVQLDNNNKINIYDKICSKWNFYSDIPVFGSVDRGRQTNFNVVSACAFYEDLDIGSPVQKRRKV